MSNAIAVPDVLLLPAHLLSIAIVILGGLAVTVLPIMVFDYIDRGCIFLAGEYRNLRREYTKENILRVAVAFAGFLALFLGLMEEFDHENTNLLLTTPVLPWAWSS